MNSKQALVKHRLQNNYFFFFFKSQEQNMRRKTSTTTCVWGHMISGLQSKRCGNLMLQDLISYVIKWKVELF